VCNTIRTTPLCYLYICNHTEGIKYFSLILILGHHVALSIIQQGMEILPRLPLAVDVFIEIFIVVLYLRGRVQFYLGFSFSNFLPAQLHYVLVIVISCLPILPNTINFTFVPAFQPKASVQPDRPPCPSTCLA